MAIQRIAEFDLWRPGYGNSEVTVYVADTTTLASLFSDSSLTIPVGNPQILISQEVDGANYGKFEFPIYTNNPYRLVIDNNEETGIVNAAITTLNGEDAGQAIVIPTNGSQANSLADILSRQVNVQDFGQFIAGGGNTAGNTATLTAAIGEAGSRGASEVILPAGVFQTNPFTIPSGVVVIGQGQDGTIIQIQSSGIAATFDGAACGFRDLTLDGVTLSGGSIGISSINIPGTILENVLVKRFFNPISYKGSPYTNWRNFSIDNCSGMGKLHGDLDSGGAGLGGNMNHAGWIGGKVTNCSGIGVSLSYEDAVCQNAWLSQVGFEDNTGTAVSVNGARQTTFEGCWWSGNTVDIDISDDDLVLLNSLNKVYGLLLERCRFDGGLINATGALVNVVFRKTSLKDVTFNMNTPVERPILLDDCIEDNVIIAGDGTKIIRTTETNEGSSTGLTTGATATKAWSRTLEPGELAFFQAVIIGNQRDGINRSIFHIKVGAYRPGSTLPYDTQTSNFTVGDILTGASSGASGRITADADGGATGTLTLRDIVGEFIDNEIITDESTGSATVNGSLSHQNVALDSVGVTAARTAYETDAATAATFVANGPELEVQVTGLADKTFEWTVGVEVLSSVDG